MNMKFAAIAALGALSLAAIAPQAAAADNGFYIGAGITQTEFDIEDIGSGELDDNSFKLIAGFRPLNWLAFEANYIDLGGFEEDGVFLDATAITVSALGIAEFGVIDLYARAGLANWKLDYGIEDFDSVDEDGWEPTFGVGVGAHFGSVGVRAEYEMFKTDTDLFGDSDLDVNTLSLSFTYTFL
jgi:hypothetical protein